MSSSTIRRITTARKRPSFGWKRLLAAMAGLLLLRILRRGFLFRGRSVLARFGFLAHLGLLLLVRLVLSRVGRARELVLRDARLLLRLVRGGLDRIGFRGRGRRARIVLRVARGRHRDVGGRRAARLHVGDDLEALLARARIGLYLALQARIAETARRAEQRDELRRLLGLALKLH